MFVWFATSMLFMPWSLRNMLRGATSSLTPRRPLFPPMRFVRVPVRV
eukprot:CAMPEP_0118884442 /NCGR_PEP_ID=MMETSP1163-20130328/23276_1 /TAXON_ID=124430 /ORGANISM="Phaeomonas parva, Strain CCMP2877" /LENGTH=46 /DNA_ID= /DNA_START= /DNA_END= /DNA_ORIENTATION=